MNTPTNKQNPCLVYKVCNTFLADTSIADGAFFPVYSVEREGIKNCWGSNQEENHISEVGAS